MSEMTVPSPTARLFVEGAHSVRAAVSDAAVESAWEQDSVLEGQRVSGLVGHLARGGVWVVADYLAGPVPSGPVDFESAGHYFDATLATATAEDHQAIRDRGAAVAAIGHAELVATLGDRLESLETMLASTAPTRLVSVIGAKTMRLDDYLATRIVEQVVHLDDLARSLGRDAWVYPDAGYELAITVGVEVARRRRGDRDVLRALYRHGHADTVLPVL